MGLPRCVSALHCRTSFGSLTRLRLADCITSSHATFETILSLLSSFFVPESEDALLAWIEKVLGDQRLRADMARWREEWRELVASGKDRDALL